MSHDPCLNIGIAHAGARALTSNNSLRFYRPTHALFYAAHARTLVVGNLRTFTAAKGLRAAKIERLPLHNRLSVVNTVKGTFVQLGGRAHLCTCTPPCQPSSGRGIVLPGGRCMCGAHSHTHANIRMFLSSYHSNIHRQGSVPLRACTGIGGGCMRCATRERHASPCTTYTKHNHQTMPRDKAHHRLDQSVLVRGVAGDGVQCRSVPVDWADRIEYSRTNIRDGVTRTASLMNERNQSPVSAGTCAPQRRSH